MWSLIWSILSLNTRCLKDNYIWSILSVNTRCLKDTYVDLEYSEVWTLVVWKILTRIWSILSLITRCLKDTCVELDLEYCECEYSLSERYLRGAWSGVMWVWTLDVWKYLRGAWSGVFWVWILAVWKILTWIWNILSVNTRCLKDTHVELDLEYSESEYSLSEHSLPDSSTSLRGGVNLLRGLLWLTGKFMLKVVFHLKLSGG